MPIEGADFDLLGVTLGRAGPISNVIHLELDQGVTALYGLNGAGKTQVLTLVAQALAGVSPQPERAGDESSSSILDVHVRLRRPLEHEDRRGPHFGLNPIAATASSTLRLLRDQLRDRGLTTSPAAEDDDLLTQLAHTWAATRSGEAQVADTREYVAGWQRAFTEAAQERRLTFRAVGDAKRPAWRVFLSCSPSSTAGGALLDEADHFHEARRDRGGRVHHRDWPPLDVVYWGTDHDPRFVADMPAVLQVPGIQVGVVPGELRFEEIRRGGPDRTTWTARDVEPGFALATVATDFTEATDPDVETLDGLLGTTGSLRGDGVFVHGTSDLDDEFSYEVGCRQVRANTLVQQVLLRAPELTWDMMLPDDWVRGRGPRWRADGWDLHHLSRAQRRWVSSSIALANRRPSASPETDEHGEVEGPPVLFLCDEPEAGLHRAAEHRLAHGLSHISRIVRGATLVATHSPDLLASQLVRSVFVTRDRHDGVVLRPVPLSIVDGLSTRESAAHLGLSSADLWALGKVTVVVEGIHDEWVFKALLRDDLDEAAAAILPMHGGTRLRSLAEARLVVDGSDAQVLVVLDDLVAAEAAEALAEVKRSVGDPEQLRSALERLRARGKENDSFLFLHQFALRASELGTLERVWVHGLSLPDVICYLDPDTVLLDDASWPKLISRWTDEAAPAAPKNLKGWLRRRRLLPDDPREVDLAVERGVLQMREERRGLHGDLVELGLRVRELAAATAMDGR